MLDEHDANCSNDEKSGQMAQILKMMKYHENNGTSTFKSDPNLRRKKNFRHVVKQQQGGWEGGVGWGSSGGRGGGGGAGAGCREGRGIGQGRGGGERGGGGPLPNLNKEYNMCFLPAF